MLRHALLTHDIETVMLHLEIAIDQAGIDGPFRDLFRKELAEIQVTSPF